MSENIEQLTEAIKEFQKIQHCKRRKVVAERELQTQKNKLAKLDQIVQKEHRDLLVLEQFSLKQLFSTILVDKEAQLEKERQEYLLAALKYNECQELVELLQYEMEVLDKQLQSEGYVSNKLESILSDLKLKNIDSKSEDLVLLKKYNQELKDLIKLKGEAKEAATVVSELKSSFRIILEALQQANRYDDWGEFYKQRQLAKVKKKQYIDRAQEQVYRIRKQFIFLRSELLDLEEFKTSFSEAQDLIIDFNLNYYNDLITDWINVLKLNETLDHTITTFDSVTRIGRSLHRLVKKSEQEYKILLVKRGTLIEKIAG